MLHILNAQMLAAERERTIQRRLREAAVRADVLAANASAEERPHDPGIHREGRRCGACGPAAISAC
jgi:hypothetical protein